MSRSRDDKSRVEPRTGRTGEGSASTGDASLLQTLLDATSESVLLADRDLRIVRCSPEGARLLGYETAREAEAHLPALLELMPAEQRERLRGELEPLLSEASGSVLTDVSIRGRKLQIQAQPVRAEPATPHTLLLIVRSDGESEAGRLRAELDEMRQRKRHIVSIVSHELRTPLVTGLGYLEMLLQGRLGPVAPKASSRMKVALLNLQRLAAKIDDLVTYHRLIDPEERQRPPMRRPIQVETLLSDSADEALAATNQEHSRVHIDVPDDLPRVLSDEKVLKGVLIQLVDNALRHAGNQSRVTLSAARLPAGEVEITVRDDGSGMSAELVESVTSTEQQGGRGRLGVGLPLASARLRTLGSDLHLQSRPGAGTRASFKLPSA